MTLWLVQGTDDRHYFDGKANVEASPDRCSPVNEYDTRKQHRRIHQTRNDEHGRRGDRIRDRRDLQGFETRLACQR